MIQAHQSRLKETVQTKPTKFTARSTFGDQLNTTEHETLAKLKEEERLRKKRGFRDYFAENFITTQSFFQYKKQLSFYLIVYCYKQ